MVRGIEGMIQATRHWSPSADPRAALATTQSHTEARLVVTEMVISNELWPQYTMVRVPRQEWLGI